MKPTARLPPQLRHAVRMLPLGLFRLSSTMLLAGLVLWMFVPLASAPVLDAGLLVLMAVPFFRVLVLLSIYLWRRDWPSALATAAVLAVVVTALAIAWN